MKETLQNILLVDENNDSLEIRNQTFSNEIIDMVGSPGESPECNPEALAQCTLHLPKLQIDGRYKS